MRRFLILLLAVHVTATLFVRTSAAEDTVDFGRDVFPILQRSCLECHGAEKQAGELRMDRRQDLLDSGTVVPGSPDDSEVLRRVLLPRGHDEIMPAIGEPLSRAQIRVIRRWIEQGAAWPEDFQPGRHWAYVAPKRPAPPPVEQQDWVGNAVDQFVVHRLRQQGLEPSPRATPEKLVRRLYLDLIGLPPSPAEVNAFVADPSDQRLEALIDDLLSRPQFGERWARPWLDLARYADSHGFQRDDLRNIWAWRDWVIQALNDDMPFDQFTVEQIAGDLLPDATESQKIATGFHRCTPTNVEAGSLPEETRVEQVLDRVNTTGAVWLGTTLECCQCHDHKYDPFTMQDYYQLLAFFNNTELEADRTNPNVPSSIQFKGPSMPLADAGKDAQRSGLQRQLAGLNQQKAEQEKELAASLESWAVELARSFSDRPQAHTLDVADFQSLGTTDSFERLDDGSILLVGGDPPSNDVYTLRVRAEIAAVRGFRLDALRHASLPGEGPGRGDPERRNFVLTDFSVEVRPVLDATATDAPRSRKLHFQSATASFSQNNWDVAGAVDDDPKSGWAIAPQFDKPHWATFELDKPIDLTSDVELVFTLTQDWGQSRSIGCLRLSALTGTIGGESVPSDVIAAAKKPASEWSKPDQAALLKYRIEHDELTTKLDTQIKAVQAKINKVEAATTLVMIELDEPRPSAMFERGDYRKPGQPVQPGTPSVLHAMPDGPPNRLTLARWLVSRDNPLAARVTVNRWWAELFGRGIVATVEDFGVKGDPASHPELLDWLAVEFMDNGWSMKRLLKTIVMSHTYQQSSRVTPRQLEQDDQNSWLGRGPSFRMDAEMIRDNALAASGLLSLKQFGPPIRPYQPDGIWKKVGGTAYQYEVSPGSEQHRRGIYVVLKRGSPYPSFINFDASARLACTVKRSRTNTPLQALTLLNDPVYVEAAQALAKRVVTEQPDASVDQQLDYAFLLCTSRRPTDTERNALRRLLNPPESDAEDTRDGWFSVATVLLNLHETVTKD